MKLGAKVPDAALFRAEFDLALFNDGEDNVGDMCETDALRRCPFAGSNAVDGAMMADFGRVCDGGTCEGKDRANGLARLGEPFNCEGSISKGCSKDHYLRSKSFPIAKICRRKSQLWKELLGSWSINNDVNRKP